MGVWLKSHSHPTTFTPLNHLFAPPAFTHLHTQHTACNLLCGDGSVLCVLGGWCFGVCSSKVRRRFTAHMPHACGMHISRGEPFAAFKRSGGTVVPPLPARQHGPALRVTNKGRARRYRAMADCLDHPLIPDAAASPSDPSLTCAVPRAPAGCW